MMACDLLVAGTRRAVPRPAVESPASRELPADAVLDDWQLVRTMIAGDSVCALALPPARRRRCRCARFTQELHLERDEREGI
jgi:hypothetical protein